MKSLGRIFGLFAMLVIALLTWFAFGIYTTYFGGPYSEEAGILLGVSLLSLIAAIALRWHKKDSTAKEI